MNSTTRNEAEGPLRGRLPSDFPVSTPFAHQWVCDPRYSPNATGVYGILAVYANSPHGQPSIKVICGHSGLSANAVRAALAELVISGVATASEGGGYTLQDAALAAGAWNDPLPAHMRARKALELSGHLSSKGGLTSFPGGPYQGSALDADYENPPVPSPRRSDPKISKEKRARIFARDGHACLACSATEDLTIDHIVHWSKGGTNHDDNLRALCHSCNSRRGAGHLAEVG